VAVDNANFAVGFDLEGLVVRAVLLGLLGPAEKRIKYRDERSV
jgi:ribosomal protein L22